MFRKLLIMAYETNKEKTLYMYAVFNLPCLFQNSQPDSVYSLNTWPIWESLCVAAPGSPERFNYCAVGGRAGHCRVSFTPEIRFPSNYCPGAYKKPKKD